MARTLGYPPAVVRQMTHRDLRAMALVLAEEQVARKRAQARAGRRGR